MTAAGQLWRRLQEHFQSTYGNHDAMPAAIEHHRRGPVRRGAGECADAFLQARNLNTGLGGQFTSDAFTDGLRAAEIEVSRRTGDVGWIIASSRGLADGSSYYDNHGSHSSLQEKPLARHVGKSTLQIRGNAPKHLNGCMKDNRDELNLVANLHGKAAPPHLEVLREHAKAQKSLFASAFPKCTVKLQKGSKLTAIAAAS